MEQLVNEFSVSLPIDKAWAILTDVEKIAPCLPGAALEEIDGEVYSGSVKVKVGPIVASYKGKASFIEMDKDAHKAVLKAEGRDTKGQGNASATITAELTAVGDATKVKVSTDLAITGRVAQFGRGVLSDVSSKVSMSRGSPKQSTSSTNSGRNFTRALAPTSPVVGSSSHTVLSSLTGFLLFP